jgi:RHS repeat-associated protein
LATAAGPGEKFATYWRDGGTGLDYAVNRYYSSQMGRLLTADQGPPIPTNPQSWNRYSYSWNDPVNLNDPDGRLPAAPPGCVASLFGSPGGAVDASSNCPPGFVYMDGIQGGWTTLSRLREIFEVLNQHDDVLSQFMISDKLNVELLDWGRLVDSIMTEDDPEAYIKSLQAAAQVLRIGSIGISHIAKKYGPAVALAVSEVWARFHPRSVVIIADCSVHKAGTPDHASAGTTRGIGVGPDEATAKRRAYDNAQTNVTTGYPPGHHAQHCNYKRVR